MYPRTSSRYDDKALKDHATDLGIALLVILDIIVGTLLLTALLEPPHYAHAYVQMDNDSGTGKQHWRQKQATLNLRLGCPDDAPCWDAVAQEAAEEWNDAGSRFRFRFLSPSRPDRLSCTNADDRNTVLWSARDCQMAIGDSALAITFNWTWPSGAIADSDVVFNTKFVWDAYDGPLRYDSTVFWGTIFDFRRVALHEFGHVLGLDHPDDHGQQVAAVMNSGDEFLDRLADDDIAGAQAIYGVDPTYTAPVVGFLENPGHRSFRSGIGVISGWVCDAEQVDVQIGRTRHRMAYRTDRADTQSACGDANNGFVTLFNYNRLRDGTHTARLLVDGRQHGDPIEFKVTTFGTEFLRGASGRYEVAFPDARYTTVLSWDQNSQNFIVREVQ